MPRRDDTFIIYYAEDFQEYETSNPSDLYCLSASTIDIILSALRFATWPTRWRSDRADYRSKVSPTEWGNLKKWGELAIQEVTYEMGCDINEGLSAIAVSLQSLANSTKSNNDLLGRAIAAAAACCEEQVINQGGGVIGSITQPIGGNEYPIFGTEPTLEVPTGTFPDGYTDEAEYLADKCQMANLVVTGVIGTLRGLGALGVFNGVALAGLIVACLVGVLVFPPAFIPIAAACIGLLSVEVTLLTLAANEIDANRGEWVCAIYKSESVESALAIIADLCDALIATIGATDLRAMAVKQILLLLFNGDTVNQAFKKTAHVVYAGADCSDCTSPDWEIVPFDGGAFVLEPVIVSGLLQYDTWVTIDSPQGYWWGDPAWLIDDMLCRTIDGSFHLWDVEYISGGGPKFQSAWLDSGGFSSWTGWLVPGTTLEWTGQNAKGIGMQSGDPDNHANPPTSVFRVRVRCRS